MRTRTGRTAVWGVTTIVPGEIGVQITRERLRQLIQLCHPDKHNNSSASVEATQWLLELRKRLDVKKPSSV